MDTTQTNDAAPSQDNDVVTSLSNSAKALFIKLAREKGGAAPGKEELWIRVVALFWLIGLQTGLFLVF